MFLKLTAFAASCVLVPSVASAQASANWAEAPSAADVAAAYPAKAKASGTGGTVQLTCTVNTRSRPKTCAVLNETPGNYGFGAAALKLSQQMRITETTRTGQEVLVPVTFNPDVLKPEGAAITKPTWLAAPSSWDFQSTFPKAENGINSIRVVLACKVTGDGGLADCAVDSESPPGHGFGDGALALASKFKLGPWSQDGQPTAGARLKLPIRYELTQVAAKP